MTSCSWPARATRPTRSSGTEKQSFDERAVVGELVAAREETRMSSWTEATVTAALGIAARAGDSKAGCTPGVSTDTRTLRGASCSSRCGASARCTRVPAAGARRRRCGAVVDHVPDDAPSDMPATWWMTRWPRWGGSAVRGAGCSACASCAVAGSNGKTTTKDMLRAVLSPKFRVHATHGQPEQPHRRAADAAGTPDDATSSSRRSARTAGRAGAAGGHRRAGCRGHHGHLRGAPGRSRRPAGRAARGDVGAALGAAHAAVVVVRRPGDAGGAGARAAPGVIVAGSRTLPTTRCAAATSSSTRRAASASRWAGRACGWSCAAGTMRATRWSRWASPGRGACPTDEAIAALQELQPPKMRVEFIASAG
jgi:hypothetical protein